MQPNTSANAPAYGYQVWLNRGGKDLRWPDLPADAYVHGNRGQVVMIIPSLDTVMVRLGWSANYYPRNQRFASGCAHQHGLINYPTNDCVDEPGG